MRETAYSFLCPNSTTMLFLEKIVECAACAGGTDGGASGIVSFPFNGGSGHEIRAFVSYIFLGDTFQNRLRTFELGTRIEVPAILAGAKIGAAFGALAALGNLHGIGDHGAAHGATQELLEARHLHPPGDISG
jgi:hypothetical protein